jgi:NADH:ubiquinone oxidoreductase subunit 6 (subunit J)
MSSTVDAVAAVCLAVAVLGGSVMMMTSKNVVHAAFWMLEAMLGTAGIYLLLSAGFLALVQVMVYAGAVAVLLLFVIMLTLRRREDAVRSRDFSWQALGIASAFLVVTLVALVAVPVPVVVLPAVTPGVAEFGVLLFSKWMLPFEVASLLLTVALVGAVWWSVGKRES